MTISLSFQYPPLPGFLAIPSVVIRRDSYKSRIGRCYDYHQEQLWGAIAREIRFELIG